MDNKNSIVLLYILGGLVLLQLLYSIFGVNKNLNDALERLEISQKRLDSALHLVSISQIKIDSARIKLRDFSSYVYDIQGRVQILDLENRRHNRKYETKADSINKKLSQLYKEFKIQEDSLAPIVEELPSE